MVVLIILLMRVLRWPIVCGHTTLHFVGAGGGTMTVFRVKDHHVRGRMEGFKSTKEYRAGLAAFFDASSVSGTRVSHGGIRQGLVSHPQARGTRTYWSNYGWLFDHGWRRACPWEAANVKQPSWNGKAP